MQPAPGDFAGRQNAIVGVWRQAECGKALLVAARALAGVRKYQHALAGLAQPGHAFTCGREDRLALVQGPPLVEQHVIEPVGDRAKAGDRDGVGVHGGPPYNASNAVPELASVCSATVTGTPRMRCRIAVQAWFLAPPPMPMTRRNCGAPSKARR